MCRAFVIHVVAATVDRRTIALESPAHDHSARAFVSNKHKSTDLEHICSQNARVFAERSRERNIFSQTTDSREADSSHIITVQDHSYPISKRVTDLKHNAPRMQAFCRKKS